jgi:hypothetical protein
MKSKKMIKDTVSIGIGAVGISEANKIPMFGSTIGTAMGAGMLEEQLPKKKKGGWF